jgi:hypothetical protein
MTSSPVAGVQVDPNVLRAANLAQVLSLLSDPRDPRGVRHPIGVVIALAAGAVAAGSRSYTAIAQWAQDVGSGVGMARMRVLRRDELFL